MVIVLPDPLTFGICILISYAVVSMGHLCYIYYLLKVCFFFLNSALWILLSCVWIQHPPIEELKDSRELMNSDESLDEDLTQVDIHLWE